MLTWLVTLVMGAPGKVMRLRRRVALVAVATYAGFAVVQQMGEPRDRLRSWCGQRRDFLERVGVLASQDELTGLVNRHSSELIANVQTRIPPNGYSMCLALIDIDIDHFKRVHDTHGHQAVDAALKAFATSMAKGLGGADMLARWDGEEFVLMVPNTSAEEGLECLECLERMRAALMTEMFDGIASGMQNTFSTGLKRPGEPNQTTRSIDTGCSTSPRSSNASILASVVSAMAVRASSVKKA